MPSRALHDTIAHVDGQWWFETPAPKREVHKHATHSSCILDTGNVVMRCACGATAYSDIPGWQDELKPRFADA